jgi:hypothetical protein
MEPLGDLPGDAADLGVQSLVEHELAAGGFRDELDRSVVVGRTEPARDEAQIRLQPIRQRRLELVGPVADDRDPRRLQPERERLLCEERTVQVRPLAPDELAAGDDDRGAGPLGIRCLARQGRCRRR